VRSQRGAAYWELMRAKGELALRQHHCRKLSCLAECTVVARVLAFVGSEAHPSSMKHRCACGLEFVLNPREIPLSEDEDLVCDCGRRIKGTRSTRYFDYEPIRVSMNATALEPHKQGKR
jgi:hypothetical protein